MTTIAWDGKTLAIDRGAWSGRMVTEVSKLHVFDDIKRPGWPKRGCWGITGSLAYLSACVMWLSGKTEVMPPLAKDGNLDDEAGLFVDETGIAWIVSERMVPFRCHSKCVGAGGGGFFVLGAMVMGATAEQAVRLAHTHTDAAAFGVDTWSPPARAIVNPVPLFVPTDSDPFALGDRCGAWFEVVCG